MRTLVVGVVTALGSVVLLGCAHAPQRSGATEKAAVVVRECLGATDKDDPDAVATVYATSQALRMDVNCGRRPFRIIYRTGEDSYVHYDVNAGERQTFTTDQVKELMEMRRSVARTTAEQAIAAEKVDGKADEQRLVTALLATTADSISPLRDAKFKPASIGETVGTIRCRRFDITSGKQFLGEACLARTETLGVRGEAFAAFASARDKFQGLLGTGFEIFDPLRTVERVDYLIVRLTFGDGSRGIAVPRLKSVAMVEVPAEAWDPNRIAEAPMEL